MYTSGGLRHVSGQALLFNPNSFASFPLFLSLSIPSSLFPSMYILLCHSHKCTLYLLLSHHLLNLYLLKYGFFVNILKEYILDTCSTYSTQDTPRYSVYLKLIIRNLIHHVAWLLNLYKLKQGESLNTSWEPLLNLCNCSERLERSTLKKAYHDVIYYGNNTVLPYHHLLECGRACVISDGHQQPWGNRTPLIAPGKTRTNRWRETQRGTIKWNGGIKNEWQDALIRPGCNFGEKFGFVWVE